MIALPYALVFWGEQFTDPAMGAVLMCANPLFIFPVSFLMKSDERLTITKFIGVFIGLLGILAIFYPKLISHSLSLKGDFAILISVIIYAVATVYLKKYASDIPIRRCVFYQVMFATPVLFIAGLIMESGAEFVVNLVHWKSIFSILYLGILGSSIVFMIYFWLIHRIGAVASASAIFIEVVLAIILDWLVLDIIPHSYTWVGVGLIFLGVWIVMILGVKLKSAGNFEECEVIDGSKINKERA